LLRLDDRRDVARATAPVRRPPLAAEIPIGDANRLENSAVAAGLEPDSASKLAAGVDSLVGDGVDELQVADTVVELVFVDVVDLVSVGDLSPVVLLPDPSVGHDEPTTPVDAQVAIFGYTAVSEIVVWFWSALAHAFSSSGLHEHNMFSTVKPASRSDRDAFGQ
jgi:hypothetical protein